MTLIYLEIQLPPVIKSLHTHIMLSSDMRITAPSLMELL